MPRLSTPRIAPLLLPLVLVNAAAVWGQSGWAYDHVTRPAWDLGARVVLALLFALAVESIGVYLAWEAHGALMADQAAGLLRAGSYAVGGFAAWLNWEHWYRPGDELALPIAFAVLSGISPWLWAVWSRARNRQRLAELGLADARGVKLSTVRKILHPGRSWKVIRWAAWAGVTSPADAVSGWEIATGQAQPPLTAWYRPLPYELPRLDRAEVAALSPTQECTEEGCAPEPAHVEPLTIDPTQARRPRAFHAPYVAHEPPEVAQDRSERDAHEPVREQRTIRAEQRKIRDDAKRTLRERTDLRALTGAQVAEMFGMRKRWGEVLLGEVRTELAQESPNGKVPVTS